MTSWELQRNWEIVRYLVYYLVEDLVSPDQISGKDIVDFSSGLGDLSEYIYSHNPKSLIATSPDDVSSPVSLTGKSELRRIFVLCFVTQLPIGFSQCVEHVLRHVVHFLMTQRIHARSSRKIGPPITGS